MAKTRNLNKDNVQSENQKDMEETVVSEQAIEVAVIHFEQQIRIAKLRTELMTLQRNYAVADLEKIEALIRKEILTNPPPKPEPKTQDPENAGN